MIILLRGMLILLSGMNVKQHEYNVNQHDYNVTWHDYTVKRHDYNVKRHDYTVTWHDYNDKGLDQGHLHPLHRASEEEARLGIASGNRTRDLLHSMQRAIGTALLTAIWNLYLYYYSSPTSRDVASSG